MDILIGIVLDLLHITKFILIGDFFLVLSKKNDGRRKESVYIATSFLSILFSLNILNSTVALVLNLLFIFGIYMFWYEEKKGKLLVVSVWSSLIVAIMDKISDVVATTILTMASVETISLEKILLQLLTLVFLGVTGALLRKKHMTGIRNIGIGYYIAFTVLSCADLGVLIYLGDFTINKVVVGQKMFF